MEVIVRQSRWYFNIISGRFCRSWIKPRVENKKTPQYYTLMKNSIFAVSIMLCAFQISAQEIPVISRPLLGFNVGVSYSNIIITNNSSTSNLKNSGGLLLGLVADFTLNEKIHFTPKVELNMQNAHVRFEEDPFHYHLRNNTIEIKPHFTFRTPKEEYESYLIIGPNIRIAVPNENTSTEYACGSDVALDIGVGGFKAFRFFGLSPELRYTYGFMNINKHPLLTNVKYHSVSLVLGFID